MQIDQYANRSIDADGNYSTEFGILGRIPVLGGSINKGRNIQIDG